METTKTVEFPIRRSKSGYYFRFRKAYDNGGKTFDRYTVTFEVYDEKTGKWEVCRDGFKIVALGMSEHPFHPQGFGQSCNCVEGRHLGKRVKFSELPPDVQRCVIQYLEN